MCDSGRTTHGTGFPSGTEGDHQAVTAAHMHARVNKASGIPRTVPHSTTNRLGNSPTLVRTDAI